MGDWWIRGIVVIVGLAMGSAWSRRINWSSAKGSKKFEDWRRARRRR